MRLKETNLKRLRLGLILFLLLRQVPPAFAGGERSGDNRWTKFGRGCSNIALCWTEIIYQPYFMFHKERFPVALFGGIAQGAAYTIGRAVAGVYEVMTFPVPWPAGYRPIIEPDVPIPKDIDTGSSAV